MPKNTHSSLRIDQGLTEDSAVQEFLHIDPNDVANKQATRGNHQRLRHMKSAGNVRRQTKFMRNIALGIGATGIAAVSLISPNTDAQPKEPQTETAATSTVDYTVQPGDNEWDIAHKIQDNTGNHGEVRPLVDQLAQEARQDGQPGLQVGERIPVPTEADIYADIPGAQLDHK